MSGPVLGAIIAVGFEWILKGKDHGRRCRGWRHSLKDINQTSGRQSFDKIVYVPEVWLL